MPWTRRKVANLGRVTLDTNYTAASGTMELTTGDSAFIPTTGTFWLAWSEDEADPDAVVHLFKVTAVSGDDVTVTAETSEGGGDTNITAGQILRVVTTIGAVEMLGQVLLEEHIASASASLDFTTCISSAYDTYEISFTNIIPATDNTDFWMRMSTDGGSTYDSGANYAWGRASWTFNGTGAATGALSGATKINVTENVGLLASHSFNGRMQLYNPGGSIYKFVDYKTVFYNQANAKPVNLIGGGIYLSTTAVNAFQFLFSSGNIASGMIRVFGLAKG